jgi:CRP/FNR family nitrogen fixation transcriptional regulator
MSESEAIARKSADSSAPSGSHPSLHPSWQDLEVVSRYDANEAIYHRNQPATHWYRIVRGAARVFVVGTDGRRQIVDFMLPGEMFGFGATAAHQCSAEAIVGGTIVARYLRHRAESLAEADAGFARCVREIAFASIHRLQMHTVILGRSSAQAKIIAFVREMAQRCGIGPANVVALPMSRYDIADHLAVAVDTVSRVLTELGERGMIMMGGGRRLQVCEAAAPEQSVWHKGSRFTSYRKR